MLALTRIVTPAGYSDLSSGLVEKQIPDFVEEFILDRTLERVDETPEKWTNPLEDDILLISVRRRVSMPPKARKSEILFRMPEQDSQVRISRQTLARLAKARGTSETEVLHFAARRLADELLPLYEQDNGPLTDQQMERVRTLADLPELGETCSSLFEI